jgi:hypothetical protein
MRTAEARQVVRAPRCRRRCRGSVRNLRSDPRKRPIDGRNSPPVRRAVEQEDGGNGQPRSASDRQGQVNAGPYEREEFRRSWEKREMNEIESGGQWGASAECH